MSSKINRNGELYVSSITESNSSSKIDAKGNKTVNFISEIVTLEDGSYWIQVQHHNNKGGANLFSNSDDFANKFVWHNSECWCAFNLIKSMGLYNGKYEFMALDGSDPTLKIKRWTQTINPFTATYNDVKPGSNNVKYIVGGTGNNGGMYLFNSETYFVVTNYTNGNWYGAFGCWKAHYGGIPGFDNAVTTSILDLYVRVSPENAKRYREFRGGVVSCTSVNEG